MTNWGGMSWAGVVLSGILMGSFAVPMKMARAWKFPHIWGMFSVIAMAVIPWLLVMLAVPGWTGVMGAVPGRGLVILLLLGLLWGVASLLYGLAVDLLGIALGYSIQLGLSIVIGAIIPMYGARSLSLRSAGDAAFLGGLTLMVAGVVVCAQAGGANGKAAMAGAARFRKGLIIAIAGGIGSPLLNIGIQYGISLIPRTPGAGLVEWVAWAVFLSAAAVSQAGFCFYRIHATREAALFRSREARHDAAFVVVMSVVWAAGTFLYGSSAAGLGRLGTSVGWPVFIGMVVIASNAWGVALGEWKERARGAFVRMFAGCAMLLVAAFVVATYRR